MLRDGETHFSGRSGTSVLPEAVSTNFDSHARLREWFQRWRGWVRRWIASNEGVASAEVDDLTQEVFLRLLRYSDDVLVENPQGYLYRVAFNVVHAWRERCSVRMPHDDAGLKDVRLDAAEQPENVCARAASIRCVRAAVDRLPTRQRELLWLHVNEEMTYKQIAHLRGLTYRTVLRDLNRAYTTLREELFSKVSSSPPMSAGESGGQAAVSLRGRGRWPIPIKSGSRPSRMSCDG